MHTLLILTVAIQHKHESCSSLPSVNSSSELCLHAICTTLGAGMEALAVGCTLPE
jgi:hypothetical protein